MLSERFDSALLFASQLHRHQTRHGSAVPYMSHLLGVASLVLEDHGSEDEAIAALLHDSVEDHGNRYTGGRGALRAEIAARFGSNVLEMVDACTDDGAYDEQGPGAWKPLKQAYLDRFATASESVRRVACADKLQNARSILGDYREFGEPFWERFRTRSRDDQLWYYGELVQVFRQTKTGRLAVELASTLSLLQAATLEKS
ncbi:Metal dependent phosphohydrolase [Candidatus Sulfopaludibacter sp. SbA3]|nr:Metal dependent phosphohydrolase [Candidatus Sulfopaludibacter sp. SbA3]